MKWLLNLYPPGWQMRYRHEMEALLEAEEFNFRTVLDLLAGAVDAWFNAGLMPDTENAGGKVTMITASRRCGSPHVSTTEALRSVAWMIGITLVLSTVAVGLIRTVGQNVMTSALLYSAFFIAFTVSSRTTYFRPYSRIARNSLIIVGTVAWYLFFLAVAALAALT